MIYVNVNKSLWFIDMQSDIIDLNNNIVRWKVMAKLNAKQKWLIAALALSCVVAILFVIAFQWEFRRIFSVIAVYPRPLDSFNPYIGNCIAVASVFGIIVVAAVFGVVFCSVKMYRSVKYGNKAANENATARKIYLILSVVSCAVFVLCIIGFSLGISRAKEIFAVDPIAADFVAKMNGCAILIVVSAILMAICLICIVYGFVKMKRLHKKS